MSRLSLSVAASLTVPLLAVFAVVALGQPLPIAMLGGVTMHAIYVYGITADERLLQLVFLVSFVTVLMLCGHALLQRTADSTDSMVILEARLLPWICGIVGGGLFLISSSLQLNRILRRSDA